MASCNTYCVPKNVHSNDIKRDVTNCFCWLSIKTTISTLLKPQILFFSITVDDLDDLCWTFFTSWKLVPLSLYENKFVNINIKQILSEHLYICLHDKTCAMCARPFPFPHHYRIKFRMLLTTMQTSFSMTYFLVIQKMIIW